MRTWQASATARGVGTVIVADPSWLGQLAGLGPGESMSESLSMKSWKPLGSSKLMSESESRSEGALGKLASPSDMAMNH